MNITTPVYYKDFKCIAGACTDTCCAGWDVDVDEDSYQYYKTVKGAFGKRLKSVMVPSEEGGCTFTLKEGGRCPFLNDENLCDLYTELGEDKLCDTCDEFPRFINEYGNIREIGIAPSCKTAGELMFSFKDRLTFETKEDNSLMASMNDIDPLTYLQLRKAREVAYDILSDRSLNIRRRLALYMAYAKEIQVILDEQRDEDIVRVVKKYKKNDFLKKKLDSLERSFVWKDELEGRKLTESLVHFFDKFKGYEVINPDWNIHRDASLKFLGNIKNDKALLKGLEKHLKESDMDYMYEYEQLAMYYAYRYFLDAVYDYDVLLKAKNAVIGILAVLVLEMGAKNSGREVDFVLRVDLAHLYSRQFEHSYYNFEVYREYFGTKRCYSYNTLMRILCN